MPFKINHLPEKYENVILPLMTINPKIVLGGSLVLYILDIMEYNFNDRTPDLDFNLLEAMTEEELLNIKDFFNLHFKVGRIDYDTETKEVEDQQGTLYSEISVKPTSHFVKKELIQLYKLSTEDEYEIGHSYMIDFFNSSYLPKKEHIIIKYKDFDLRLTHPSVILSHKSKYAYDPRVGKQYKHFQDLQQIDWKKYFQIVKKFRSKWEQKDGEEFLSISYYYVGEDFDDLDLFK